MKILKQLICPHNDLKMLRWHFTHGPLTNDPCFIEYEVECQTCGKQILTYTKDSDYMNYIRENFADAFST